MVQYTKSIKTRLHELGMEATWLARTEPWLLPPLNTFGVNGNEDWEAGLPCPESLADFINVPLDKQAYIPTETLQALETSENSEG